MPPEPGTPILPAPKKLRMKDESMDEKEEPPPKTFPTEEETRSPNTAKSSQQDGGAAASSMDGEKAVNTETPATPVGKGEGDDEEWAHVEEATIEGTPAPPKTAAKHPHSSVPVEPHLFAMISKYMSKHADEAKPLTVVLEGIGDKATREMMAGTLLTKIQSLDPAEYEAVIPTEDDQLHARRLWVATKEGSEVTQQWHLDQAATKEAEAGTESKEELDRTTEIDFEARATRRAQKHFRPAKTHRSKPDARTKAW